MKYTTLLHHLDHGPRATSFLEGSKKSLKQQKISGSKKTVNNDILLYSMNELF
ncbi:MAG: hypothetical protein ACJAZS_000223 [Alteromonas naphthalenivorans]|jgi:hypothetical protein